MKDLHEDLSRHDDGRMGSEKSFGLVFAAVFTIVGILPMFSGGQAKITWLAVAVLFAIVALIAPRLLAWPNRIWYRFGLLIAAVVSPVALAIVYYVSVVPIGLMLRLARKDILRRRVDESAQTYWITRQPPGPDPKSFRDQF